MTNEKEDPLLLSLSEECLVVILSCLNERELLTGVGCTCRTLHRLAVDSIIWKNYFRARWPYFCMEEGVKGWLHNYQKCHQLLRPELFNIDPTLTIKHLKVSGLLRTDEDVAKFIFYESPKINSIAAMIFFFHRNRRATFESYLSLLDLADRELDDCLRLCMQRVCLPSGNLTKVYLDLLAKAFLKQNGSKGDYLYASESIVSATLSLCLAMSENLHNPTFRRDRISLKTFSASNFLITYPTHFKDKLYARLEAQEIKNSDIVYEGKATYETHTLFGVQSQPVILTLTQFIGLRFERENSRKVYFLSLYSVTYKVINDREQTMYKLEVECGAHHTKHNILFDTIEERTKLIEAIDYITRFRKNNFS